MALNQTSMWIVMTIWITQELPLQNFERLDILCAWIGHPSEKLWPFLFLKSFRCSVLSVSIYYAPESELRVKRYHQFQLLESFRCSISSVSIYYAPESDLRVKSYDHLNFSRSYVVQFRATPYVMCLNRTSEWKIMTILISRELPFFNFERLDIRCAWIGPPCKKLWPFEFLEIFRGSISDVSICDVPESDLRVKSYCRLNLLKASVFNYERLHILRYSIGHPSEKLLSFDFS